MLEIQRWISDYNYSNGRDSYKYIVLHWTGNETDTAKGNANYFNGGNRNASAHYFCDNNSIYQVVEDYNTAWHVGDNKGYSDIKNRNSIGIEMCGENGDISEQTIANTLDLVKYLMNKYDIDIEHIKTHNQASGKICPEVWSYNNWSKWYEFKNRLINGGTKQGWNQNSTGWWYCTDVNNGYYYKDVWKLIDNEYYYFNENGYAKQSAWQLYNNKWYYLDKDCKMSKSKWISWKDEFYYVNEKGEMLVNCFTPDNYWVNSDGSWNNKPKGTK